MTWLVETRNTKTGETGKSLMTNRQWTTPETAEIQAAQAEEHEYSNAYLKKLGLQMSPAEAQKFLAGLTGLDEAEQQKALAGVGAELAKVHGYAVVTDLAWPHIAGVRYWVALGVPVVSHHASRDFLQQVVDHRWMVEPDLLEKRRATAKLDFHAVEDRLDLGAGAVRLRAIDGAGSEGALMAYIPSDRFLYAGDYIQPGGPGSFSAVYAREVRAAVQRAGFTPSRFIAMHMKLGNWDTLEPIALRGTN